MWAYFDGLLTGFLATTGVILAADGLPGPGGTLLGLAALRVVFRLVYPAAPASAAGGKDGDRG